MRTLIKQWSAAGQQQSNRNMFNGSGGVGGGGGSGGDQCGGNGAGDGDQGPPDLLDPDIDGADGGVDLGGAAGGNGSGSNTGMIPGYGEMLSDSQSQQMTQPLADPVFDAAAFSNSPLDPDLTLGGLSFVDLSGKGSGSLTPGGLLDTPSKAKKKKRKASDVGWPNNSPKRKPPGDDLGDSSGDDDSTSLGTPTSRETSDVRGETPTSTTSGLDFPTMVDLENSVSGLTSGDKTSDNELEEVMLAATGELDDPEDVFKTNKAKKKKNEKERTANDILMDLENKNLVPPSVSITPITGSNFGSVLSGMGLDRRPGIEIIPITSSPPAPVPTSITITPIPKSLTDERSKDRKKNREGDKSGSKSSSSGSSDKKRKRKREESPMGPPEKIPPKNDPLSKRVTVSIEPAESSPASPVSAIRKFASSPTGGNSSSNSPLSIIPAKGSPGPSSKTSKSSHQSPKHSPAYSPKSNLISSPKTSSSAGSPKSSNSSNSSAGKPSLTTLKTSVSSPSKDKSSKSSSSKSSSNSSTSSDKSGRKSPKMKSSSSSGSSSVKSSSRSSTSSPSGGGGPPTGGGGGDGGGGGGGADSAQIGGAGTPAPSGGSDSGKASSLNSSSSSSRNRKGSLSDIVDKLKSAQAPGELSVSPHKDLKKDRDKKAVSGTINTSDIKTTSSTPPPTPGSVTQIALKADGKSGEYMVKPSSDGMKITINKTKTRDKLKERTHSGLKPGVSSGPLSKKLASTSSNSGSSKSSSSSVSSGSSLHKKKPESASSSSTSKIAKDKIVKSSSASPSSSSFLSNVKDKTNASAPASSLSFSSASKKENAVFTVAEAGLIKALDTKFQIPKLSARTNQLMPPVDKNKGLSMVRGPEENPPPSPSSSVSVHIVPSLRLSPRRSPGISEDDLMDEALVGGK